jgi:hypothetical protein
VLREAEEEYGWPQMLAGLGGVILLLVALTGAHLASWARIDSAEELAAIRLLDVFLGLLFAGAVLLFSIGAKSRRNGIVLAFVVWVIASGFFLLWHETQARIRWADAKRGVTRGLVKGAQIALRNYAEDCGSFPPQDKGLAALRTNPGVAGWKGPYLEAEDLIDPWGNPLRYSARGDQVEVWSNGPDGQSGTTDDIRVGANEE